MVDALLWLGGWWRALAAPAASAACVLALVANTVAPGSCRRVAERWRRGVSVWLACGVAFVLCVVAAEIIGGRLTPRQAALRLGLFVIQVALYQRLLEVLAALAIGGGVLAVDWRAERALTRLAVAVSALMGPRLPRVKTVAAALAIAVVAGSFAGAVWGYAMQGWGRAEPADAHRFSYYASFVYRGVPADGTIVERSGFEPGYFGLELQSGASGTIVFRLEREPETTVLLRPNFYDRNLTSDGKGLGERRFPNALELAAGDGQPYRSLLANRSIGEVVGNEVLDLTPLLGASRVYRLRFSAVNTTDSAVTVLPAINVSAVLDAAAIPQPTFLVVAYAGLSAVLLFLVLTELGLARRDAALAAFAATAPVTLATRAVGWVVDRARFGATGDDDLPGVVLFDPNGAAGERAAVVAARAGFIVLLLAVGALTAWQRRVAGTDRSHAGRAPAAWLAMACMVVGLIAADARWSELMTHRYDYLVPDAWGYQSIAGTMPRKMASFRPASLDRDPGPLWSAGYDGTANALAVFYAGGNNGREPGWPVALRLVFNVIGSSGFHTRLVSLVFGVAAAVLTCAFGWYAVHPLVGLTAGSLYALNVGAVSNSVLGLREELVTVILLVLVWGLFLGRRPAVPAVGRIVAAGMAAGALVLVRADMLILATELLALTLVARWLGSQWGFRWRQVLLAGALMAVVAGPMYMGFAATHGDPFYPGMYGATVNRNLEFPERHGTPGFPTPEEYAANWSSGPPISPMTYFFGYHTVTQFVAYAARGVPRIFYEFVFRNQPWHLALFAAGLAALIATWRWLIPMVLVVALVPFYSFMAGAPGPMFVPRYAHHALPYAEIAAACGLWAVPLGVWWLWRRQYQMPAWGSPSAEKNLSST